MKKLLYFSFHQRRRLKTILARRKKRKSLLQCVLILLRVRLMMRERNYITVACLHDPHEASWQNTYRKGNDRNFVSMTSLSRKSFDDLLLLFSPIYEERRRWKYGGKGRPPKMMYPHEALGLILTWYTDSMAMKSLCHIFGCPPATCCRALQEASTCLSICLKDCPAARIAWPSHEEQVLWASLVEKKNPLVKGRWGFIDGKNFHVQNPKDSDLQNAMYNGWLHCTLVTGCFCFSATGLLVWGKHNVVGSWNDGDISRPFQEKLCRDDINVPGHGVLSDSAFPVSGDCFRRIMTPMKEGEEDKISNLRVRRMAIKVNRAITSMRQPAEWGMGAVEKVYRRLLLPLPYDKRRRGELLRNIYRLYNYRVRTVGISQIKNYFLHDM